MIAQVITGEAVQTVGEIRAGRRGTSSGFDLVLADPPFNVGKDYGAGADDARAPEEYAAWMAALAAGCYAAAAEHATCYWFCPGTHLVGEEFHLPAVLRRAGWAVRDKELCVWYRPNGPGPKKRGSGQVWAAMSEWIVMAIKGRGLWPRDHGGLDRSDIAPWYHNVMSVPTPQSNHPGGRFHPCQKPIRLYRYLIEAHQGVGRVLDPTCGSGSSLVACAQLGIDAIGIELVKATAELARARVQAALDAVPYQMARQGQMGIFTPGLAGRERGEP